MKIYWAKESPENIGKEVIKKFDDWKRYLIDTGLLRLLRKSYICFYGNPEIKDLDQSLKAIHVNNYASLIRQLHVMVTSQRPAWAPRAINSDLESQASCELAEGLLDYYMREKSLETKLNLSTLISLFLREGWTIVDWDPNAGKEMAFDEETNEAIFEGDAQVRVKTMLDVARDIHKRDQLSNDWYIVRDFKNKWDLIEKYPQFSEKLHAISGDNRTNWEYELNVQTIRKTESESDLIPVYRLYHAKTPALPEGRLVDIVSDEIILFDGPLPYKRPYCFCTTTSEYIDMPFGHSTAMDLLPLQDAMDSTFSAILTNQSANAVQNFQMPKGSGLRVTQVMEGMNVIEFDPKLGGLAPLDLLKTAPEVFNFADIINNYMQLLSGISSITRGEAPASMSGAAMALLQQQSLQFSNGLQLSHNSMLENVGTALIELFQEFAEEPRLAIIAGKTKKPLMKYFSGKDLSGVNRVIVDVGNAMAKTGAGRMELAKDLLQIPGAIRTPDQYLGVMTTGNLEPLYEHDRSRQHLIKEENEALTQGQPVQAVLTDDHSVHILEHSCVANNLEVRKNPEILQGVLTHIMEHMNLAQTMNPAMAAMLKQTSFATPPPQGGNPNQVMTPPNEQPTNVNLPQPAESPLPPQQ
jgi:hypothetical protein